MENFECLTLQNISKMDINQDFAQKYLEYLVTLMKLNKPIDFIQAALVMQTLSSVFAKKVDHLQEQILAFTIVFRKLELGAQSDNDDVGSENSDGQERTKAIRKKNADKDVIMHVFENVCTANNIRKSCIKKWSEKDIKKVDPYSIRNKINECPKMKTKEIFSCYIYDNKLDKLGKKEEFGCNGILCENLIPKDNFCLSCSHSWNLSSYNETVNGSTMAVDIEPPNIIQDDAPNSPEGALPSDLPNENEHRYDESVKEFLDRTADENDSVSDFVYFQRINKVQEALVDVEGICNIMWSPIIDGNKLLERKIKKKNVKLPIDDPRKDESMNQSKMPYPSDYVLADLMLAVFKLKSNFPLHPHFTTSLRLEKEYRNKHIEKKTGKRLRNAVTNPRNADFRGFNAFGDNDNHDFDHEHDVAPDCMDPALGDSDSPNNDDCMRDALQHIRGFQQGLMNNNQQEDAINEIALKVSAWHDSIRPHLEREEGRTDFDIHEYGSKILQTFPSNNAKTSLTFGDCVQNEARDEIPRYFLSSLLLANSYNVEITKSKPEELSVNDMMLTLLSRVRHHEVLDEGMRKEFS